MFKEVVMVASEKDGDEGIHRPSAAFVGTRTQYSGGTWWGRRCFEMVAV